MQGQDLTIGFEAETFCPKQDLYLSPIARIDISIKLPKFTIPGQSISNWDLMERLKKGIAPLEFASIRVTESSLEGVSLEADLVSKKIMRQVMKILDSLTVKVSGFSDPVRVRATEARCDFPRRHDWDLFFMKNKLDESKPGERPDTVYLEKIPIKWFAEKGCDKPNEDLFRTAMETFGKVRLVDIPSLDDLRKEMSPQISGIKPKAFSFGQDVFFEAFVQYTEYAGFAQAMVSFQNMKWTKKIDGKVFHANVKVDFDRTRHLSDASVKRRQAEREKILAERRRIVEEEKRRIAEEEAKARRILEEKEKRREERERKRKEKYEAERLRKEQERLRREEEERRAKEAELAKLRELETRVAESRHLLTCVFAHIQRKEDRRKEVQEARIRAEQRVVELQDVPLEDKEHVLRTMLLRQRELRMREELKEKMARALEQSARSANGSEEKHGTGSPNGAANSSSDSSPESESSPARIRRKKRHSTISERTRSRTEKHRSPKPRLKRHDTSDSEDERPRKRRSKNSSSSDSERDHRRHHRHDSSESDHRSSTRSRHRREHKKNKKRRRKDQTVLPCKSHMTDVSQRLQNADDRSVVLRIMTEAKKSIVWEQDCSSVLEAIIDEIEKIDNYLTQNEISSYVDSCFSTANPLYALPVLSARLSSRQMSDRILFWISLCLREDLAHTLKDSVNPNNDDFVHQSYEQFISCLVFLREKACSSALKKISVVQNAAGSLPVIENTLCISVTECLQYVFDSIVAEKDVDLRVVSLLVAKSRSVVVQDTTLLNYVVNWLCSREESPIWDRIAQRIFTDDSISSRDAEALITAVVLCASSVKDLMRCFGLAVRRNAVIRRVCCTKLFLQRVCEASVALRLAEYLHQAATKEIFVETMEAVVSVWSDPAHVRYVAVEQQMHLTRVVLALGRWLNELELENRKEIWQKLFDSAIQGVEQRLANPDTVIRQAGMFVGETFSIWMGGERLEFDYQNDSWLDEMRSIRDGTTAEPKSETVTTVALQLEKCDMQLPTSSSSVANTQPYDSDDEEDFLPYDVPESERNVESLPADAEPERTAPPPSYIRDCMEQLSEKEKYEVFEAALFALDAMIRRKAVGFVDIAEQLAKKLVYLENKFSTKNFEETRKQCLTSCLVMRPEIAPKLGDIVFSRHCSFFHRYLILECFLAAAKELSEFQKEPAKKIVEIPKEEKEKGELNDWRSIVDARIRSHTRRFTTEKKSEPITSCNRFAPVATLFFYPLLKTKTEEHLELKGRDSPFLARVLFCVSEILQKAANAPTVVRMASSLAVVVGPLRFHPDAYIRSAVLYAYFSIANAVPQSVFIEFFGNVVRSWIEWTLSLADNVDAAEHQRVMAKNVAAVLLQKIGANETLVESDENYK